MLVLYILTLFHVLVNTPASYAFPVDLEFSWPSQTFFPLSDMYPANETKLVFAHFMVGNTYPYTVDDWKKDIALASTTGIDAFALNIGRDSWQPARVADAYTACLDYPDFRLFISFDMSSLPCSSFSDAEVLREYIGTYVEHRQQLKIDGKSLVSTFAGEACTFGGSTLDEAWNAAIKDGAEDLPDVSFVPAFFVEPGELKDLRVLDGAFSWNSAWPMGDYDANFDLDKEYISNLEDRLYMAGVSPWFFTHYSDSTYNKNFIYRNDDWLIMNRWELLVQNRESIDMAEIITWNDYGESSYIGPVDGAQPDSQQWVDGFDHQGWLDLIQFYISAFKTGVYPTVTEDRIFLWARLYPSNAYAADPVKKPDNWQYTEDYLWAALFLQSSASVTLTCGPSSQTWTDLVAGVSKLKLPLVMDCAASARIERDSKIVLELAPEGLHFQEEPPSYNFNAFVSASP